MAQSECVSIECIYNDKVKKGLCIGVSKYSTYGEDVIKWCWVNKKPSLNVACDVDTEIQMTPREAIASGVALIRASIIGEHLLNTTRVKGEPKKKNEKGEVT